VDEAPGARGVALRKRACWWLAGVALVVGALLLTDRLLWVPGLTEENVRRIRPGMTLAEVEALLGGPAADSFEMPADFPAYRWPREWRAEGAVVDVQFFADGTVMAAGGGKRGPAPSPAWAPGSDGNGPPVFRFASGAFVLK
jgi:hypothetical protein